MSAPRRIAAAALLALAGAIGLAHAQSPADGGAAAGQPAPAPAAQVTIPPEVLVQCQAEGGCSLFTAARLRRELEAAFMAGVRSVPPAAASQSCDRKGSI